MQDLTFTRRGWVDDEGLMPCVEYAPDGKGGITYSMVLRKPPRSASCFYSVGSPQAVPPHEDDVLSLLLNIVLGQRATTPLSQNHFIGRYNRTFFSGGAHIGYTVKQEHVTNICAMANYIHMTARVPQTGACERVFDEYRFVVGNLAYTLYWTARRYDAITKNILADAPAVKRYVIDKGPSSKHNLSFISAPKRVLASLSKAISTPEDAIAIAEGAMIACCVHDHTSIAKDRSSARIKAIVGRYLPKMEKLDRIIDEMNNKEGPMRLTKRFFDALAAVTKGCDDKIWIVLDASDDKVEWFAYERAQEDCDSRYAKVEDEYDADNKRISRGSRGAKAHMERKKAKANTVSVCIPPTSALAAKRRKDTETAKGAKSAKGKTKKQKR